MSDTATTFQHHESAAAYWCRMAQERAAEIDRLRGLIGRDRTELARGLAAVRARLRSSWWVGEPDQWGCYEEYEQGEAALRREVAELLEETDAIALRALRASGDRATEAFHGPLTPSERERLRAELDVARADQRIAERARDRARQNCQEAERHGSDTRAALVREVAAQRDALARLRQETDRRQAAERHRACALAVLRRIAHLRRSPTAEGGHWAEAWRAAMADLDTLIAEAATGGAP